MIDVIFLLLVFFICTVKFERHEETIRADLPARGATADPLALESAPVRIVVAARIGGRVSLTLESEDGAVAAHGIDSLATQLASLCRRDGARGLYEPSHRILVTAAPDASWEDAVGAFDAAARAGFLNVGFAGQGP